MYDETTGIEVYVKPYGSEDSYPEYKAPPVSPFYNEHTNAREAYIEARSNERFYLGVNLHAAFDFRGCSDVKIKYKIDGGAVKESKCRSCGRHAEGITVEDRVEECSRLVEGEWKRAGFTFETAIVVDGIEHTQDEENDILSRRGKIVFIIQRGTASNPHEGSNTDSACNTSEKTSKIVAVDNGRSHYLKAVILGDDDPTCSRVDFTPAPDGDGEKIRFTIFYCYRAFLVDKKIKTLDKFVDLTNNTDSGDDEGEMPRFFKPEPSPVIKYNNEHFDLTRDHPNGETIRPLKRVKTEPIADNETSDKAIRTRGNGTASANNRKKQRLLLELKEVEIHKKLMAMEDGEEW